MAHYRQITVEGRKYQWVVGRAMTQIKGFDVNGGPAGVVVSNDELAPANDEQYTITPADIRAFILRSIGVKEEVKAPAKAAKIDPGPRTRGFAKLIGERIFSVDVNEFGYIEIETDEAEVFVIASRDGSPFLISLVS